MSKMTKIKKLLEAITPFGMTVHADVAVATETGATNGGTLFSDAVRVVYSKEIEFKALPNMRFMQFAQTKTELGTEPGLTISMLTYNNLTLGGKLEEMKT